MNPTPGTVHVTLMSGEAMHVEGTEKRAVRSSKVPGMLADTKVRSTNWRKWKVSGENNLEFEVDCLEVTMVGCVIHDGEEAWCSNEYKYVDATSIRPPSSMHKVPAEYHRMWKDLHRQAVRLAQEEAERAMRVLEREYIKASKKAKSSKVPGLVSLTKTITSRYVQIDNIDIGGGMTLQVRIKEITMVGIVQQNGTELWRSQPYYYKESSTARTLLSKVKLPDSKIRMWDDLKAQALRLAQEEADRVMKVFERELTKKKADPMMVILPS